MSHKKSSSSNKSKKLPLIITLCILAGLVGGYFFIPAMEQSVNETWNILTSDDREKIRRWVNGFGWWGPVVIITTMILQTFLLFVPTVAMMIVTVLAYGPWWGSILAFTAVTVASSIGYIVGRYLGELFVRKLVGDKTENKIEDFIKDYGFGAVFLFRINSLLSNDAISFISGMLGMNFTTFITATISGITPLILLIAIFSQSMDELKTGMIWISVISLVGFGFYWWWGKNR